MLYSLYNICFGENQNIQYLSLRQTEGGTRRLRLQQVSDFMSFTEVNVLLHFLLFSQMLTDGPFESFRQSSAPCWSDREVKSDWLLLMWCRQMFPDVERAWHTGRRFFMWTAERWNDDDRWCIHKASWAAGSSQTHMNTTWKGVNIPPLLLILTSDQFSSCRIEFAQIFRGGDADIRHSSWNKTNKRL